MMINFEIFIKTIIMFMMASFLVISIIHIWVKYHHPFLYSILIGLTFYLLSSVSYLLYTVAFGLKNLEYYLLWSRICLFTGTVIIISTIIIFKIMKKQKLSLLFKTSDYQSVFYKMNVLSFITNVNDDVLLVNHEAVFFEIFDATIDSIDLNWIDRIKDCSKKNEICWIYDKCFYIMVTPLKNKKEVIGFLITLDDITEVEKQKQSLNTQNNQLIEMNHVLEETMTVKSHLTIEENRLDVLTTIQEELISEIQNIVKSIDEIDDYNIELYHKRSEEVADGLRQSYKRIRETIRTMKGDLNG